MVVTIAGIKRSGSTAMYNIVRFSLLEAGYDVNICGHSWDERRKKMLGEKEADIIKRHPFDETIAEYSDHIFITDRNDEDILKSLDRMWGSGNPEHLRDMRNHLNKWKQYTDIPVLHYSEFDRHPMNWVASVIKYLDVGLTAKDAKRILDKFNEIEPPEKKQDPVTLLFPNHISDADNS